MANGIVVLISLLPVACIVIGLVIGALNYIKHGSEIRKRVEKEFREKRLEGGIKSLYYKRPDKRVAYETFGKPLFISFAVAIMIMAIIFSIY